MDLKLDTRQRLNNGIEMPMVGLGVWHAAAGRQTVQAVGWALEAGYRLVDTAAIYGNEAEVGRAVRESGLPREAVFVTTKLWNSEQLNGTQQAAFEKSLDALGLEYIDLYLVHWPVPGRFLATWAILEELYQSGRVKAIGVSNFHQHHLQALLAGARVAPAVNQIELHPYLAQVALCDYCQKQGIAVQSWRPLGAGKSDLLQNPVIGGIAAGHGKTHAQVILRWNLQRGIHIIPKSVHKERIAQNADLFDFELSQAEMDAITGLDSGTRYGENPDHMENHPKLLAR